MTPRVGSTLVLEVHVSSLSPRQLLERLEQVFPNRLPRYCDYDPSAVLVDIGRQEAIALLRRFMEET